MEPQLSNNKEEVENETAMEKSAGQSSTSTPCRAIRGRGDGCLKTEVTCPPETNGAATSVAGSGRVLRDRSTRTIPVWRQSDIGEDRDEVTRDAAANRRRKAKCPRRRKSAASAAGSSDAGRECGGDCDPPDEFEEIKDALVNRAARGRRVQVRSGARTCRGSPRTVFKIEPEMDIDYVEANKAIEKTGASVEKKEEESMDDEDVVEEEENQFLDDPKDENYLPHSHSEEEDAVSSDEDVPFRDDLNDQSYDPKDFPKARRRPPTRLKEKKDRAALPETTTEQETEIKTEGGESTDVQTAAEVEEGAEPPRKGRRRKDDKSPRLPKRRKKPPVQYVRCEMEGCGTVLAHPRYLQHHIKYQHLMKKKYVCPHPSCGRLFRLQKQLLRHAKHHTDQRDYICEFCARAFKSSHNLAVHRMIHTGEKPLQCEICGFTCRQKASLNWHMKKHDADATYQFSCSICGKKFEKKDSVVAHKAKSHPEVLIAEALAANAGQLITTPAGVTTLLETSTGSMQTEQVVSEAQGSSAIPVGQVAPVTHMGSVMVVDQDHPLHTMQVPVTLALPSTEEENRAPSQQTSTHSLQMPLQFVSTPVSQQHQMHQIPIQPSTTSITQQAALVQQLPIQSYSSQSQIVHMAFRGLPQQQPPLLSVAQQLPLQTTQSHQNQTLPRPPSHNPAPNTPLLSQTLPEVPADSRSILGFGSNPPPLSTSTQSSATPLETRQVVWEGDGTNENGNGGGVWEVGGGGEEQNMTDSSDGQIQRVLM
ncbi:E3 ubiquitin-protein ligase ZFP91-like isoform X2 [Carassius carassius]|uniref:E3 ubiquitin-protein ligase ZFP91-like isoform X2 n=1 Tax=Carassius carassius TaxID=217509 RepID=UPI002868E178|nr:E3 ubiquitin-protein ligase ZFP91-like isoform X2 [Carassius carassius]